MLVFICVWFYSIKHPKSVIFTGINGEQITVYTTPKVSIVNKSYVSDNESVKAGDIIRNGDSIEIVIGVSDDGRYITMPYEE